METPDWIVLYTLSSDIEADIITGILENENIPVQKNYPGINPMLKITLGNPLNVELLVPKALAEEAWELIETHQFQNENNTESLDEDEDGEYQSTADHTLIPFETSPVAKLPWYWWLILIAALTYMLVKI